MRRSAWILTPWAAIIVLWYGVARSGLVNPGLVPTPYQVVERFWNLLTRDSLGLDILFYAASFAGVIVMYEGIGQISPIFVRVARTLGATDSEIFRKVVIPLAVPHMLTALRVALGVAWATLVAPELIAAWQGLGGRHQNASSFFQLDTIYVGIICIGFVALGMDLLLRAVARRFVSWQERINL